MATQSQYAFRSDDLGTVDAVDIEASTALHLLAAVPPRNPAVAEEVLLGLEPAQAVALYDSSSFYQEIGDSDGFRERYRRKWLVVALVNTRFNPDLTYHLFRTRVVGDVKTLYEEDTDVARADYTMLNSHDTSTDIRVALFSMVNPTAQSSLQGMMGRTFLIRGVPHLEFDVHLLDRPPSQPHDFTHYFENGEEIKLSE